MRFTFLPVLATALLPSTYAIDSSKDTEFNQMKIEMKLMKSQLLEMKSSLEKSQAAFEKSQASQAALEKSQHQTQEDISSVSEAVEEIKTGAILPPLLLNRQICHRESTDLYAAAGDEPDSVFDAAKLIYNLGDQFVSFGETLLIEVTASTFLYHFTGDGIGGGRRLGVPFAPFAPGAQAGIYLRAVLDDYIKPEPDLALPLQATYKSSAIGVDAKYFFYHQDGDYSTNTAKFLFPDLPKGKYRVQLQIFAVATDFDFVSILSYAALGPHIIDISVFRSDNSICPKISEEFIDDDEDATVDFDDVIIPDYTFNVQAGNETTSEEEFLRKKNKSSSSKN